MAGAHCPQAAEATPFSSPASMTMEPPATRVPCWGDVDPGLNGGQCRPQADHTGHSGQQHFRRIAGRYSDEPLHAGEHSMSETPPGYAFSGQKQRRVITPTSSGWYRRICSSRASISLKQKYPATFGSSGNSSHHHRQRLCADGPRRAYDTDVFHRVTSRIIFVYLFIIAYWPIVKRCKIHPAK